MIIKYLGHSAFQITTERGVDILIDPFLKGKIESLTKVDLLLVSHGAPDHFGDTVNILRQTNAKVVCDPSLKARLMQEFNIDEARLIFTVWGWVREEMGIKIRAVENRHISFYRSGGSYLTGLPLSFVIYLENGLKIFHPGDTSIFSDFKLIGELYRPDVALMPVGAAEDGFAEMSPAEAAQATLWIRPDLAIPMHYIPGDDSPDKFAQILNLLAPEIKVIVMEPSSSLSYSKILSIKYPV
ncbi:MAG: metal-dependent hydrolase [Dehalococcoidia bacterium]|nr:metal-dependent hydrolase [Dehalococcoidia bacterium]